MGDTTRPRSKAKISSNEDGTSKLLQEDREKKKLERNTGIINYVMVNHMWVFTIWLIPISIFYDFSWWVHAKYTYWVNLRKPSIRHESKVKDVQRQVGEWKKSGCGQPMCTGRSEDKSITLQRLHYKDRMYKIYLDMADIIKIDVENKFVRVEPYVTIGILNDFLIGKGWTLPVVPELDDLTIGGLVMGGGIESTCHKYGFFHLICRAYEVVLGDGTLQWVSPTENKELFAQLPFSYGTLGFLMSIDIDIIPYKPYVELTYHNVKCLDQVVKKFTEVTNNPEVDSVEGIMYSLNKGVIMSGKFVDAVPKGGNHNALGRWYKPWFYKHVESYMDDNTHKQGYVEYIPTRDFFHRHNRSYFWMMHPVVPFANHFLFRWLFGWTMPLKFSLLKALRRMVGQDQEVNENTVLQDYIIKLNNLKSCLELIHTAQEVYPLWLCPARDWNKWKLDCLKQKDNTCYVDIGVYGWSPIENFDPIGSQRRMEKFATEHQGYAALYAETQLTEEEFIKMFNDHGQLDAYHKLRKELDCEKAFPTIYEKVSRLGRSMS